MRKSVIVFMVIFFIKIKAQHPTFDWVKTYNGGFEESVYTPVDQVCKADKNGCIYLAGLFGATINNIGVVDFDPGPNNYNLTAIPDAGGLYKNDGFITKVDAAGNFLWAKQIGGAYSVTSILDITIDAHNNLIAVGTFAGRVDFDPGATVYNLTSEPVSGNSPPYNFYSTTFILKLDSNGNFMWAKSLWAQGMNAALSVTIDSLDNIYLTGRFWGKTDFNTNLADTFYVSNGNTSAYGGGYILSLNSSGDFNWVKTLYGQNSQIVGNCIELDAVGNVLIAGEFSDSADFDPGANIYALKAISNGSYSRECFLLKLDPQGNFLWCNKFGSIEDESIEDITIDKFSNIIIAGSFKEAMKFTVDTGILTLQKQGDNFDAYLAKFNPTGTLSWAFTLGGPIDDVVKSVSTDISDNIFYCGYFGNSLDVDPSPISSNIIDCSLYDAVLSKISPAGNFLWTGLIASSPSYESAESIVIDVDGNIISSGYFSYGSTDFDPDTSKYLISNGDGFYIHKMASSSPTTSISRIDFNSLKVYPSPTSGLLNISFDEMMSGSSLNIYSADGRKTFSAKMLTANLKLDIEDYPNGLYIIELKGELGFTRKKIVKM